MIKHITIKDYILINELAINLDERLNVITGETGAGKSIIINAIDLVFAPRVSKDVIKDGANKAVIEITIEYNKNYLNEIFKENGIDFYNNEIIISKEISNSSVKTRVNGSLVNQDFVKLLKEKLVDIHSQNQTYEFLQPKHHINLLDNYAKNIYGEILSEYKEKYLEYKQLCKKLEDANLASNATENQIEFLKFQIEEIEAAEIKDINEDVELKNELVVLENAEKLKELTGTSYWAINGDDGSIIDALSSIRANLSKAVKMDSSLENTETELTNACEVLHDISGVLRDYSQNLDNDTERLNYIQERLFLIDKLKRKYGGSLEEIIKTLSEFKKQYEQIEFSTKNIEDLEADIQACVNKLNKLADLISENRRNIAQNLSDLIVEKLEKLELPKVKFKIEISPIELSKDGKDKVEFLISTNISESLKPLAKVASGGEISRVMLAIKSIFAQSDEIDTVIFDEIDTGISGKTSQSVADEIANLAQYHQIIVITHQAIVASKANTHFYISKSQDEETQVNIKILNGEEKIQALAELAAGEINQQSIDFARSLL